jgi:flagellar hook-associated protein 2
VTVNQNAAGLDLNSDGEIGDRKDTLQAIQTAIDATGLNGLVEAKFDKDDRLIFETVAEGSAKSIEITAKGSTASDTILGLDATQGLQTNGKDPGLVLGSAAEFKIELDGLGTTTNISVPPGTYLSGDALATEIQNQIQATLSVEPGFSSVLKGGEISNSTRDLSAVIDFSTAASGFTVNVSGVEKEIIINNNGTPGDNLANIQSALDAAFPPVLPAGTPTAEGITASLVDNKLVLTQNKAGHEQFIQVTSDGRGSQTTVGTVALTGTDFSTPGNNANFTLTLDGIDLNIDVNSNATLGTNDAESTRKAIETAVNTALDGNADFAAGDVLVKLDASN